MRSLAILFSILGTIVLFIDFVFLPKTARNAWKLMVVFFIVCLLCIIFPSGLDSLSYSLFKIPRGADLLVYIFISFLIRDYFISRHHMNEMSKQILKLVREDAKANAVSQKGV